MAERKAQNKYYPPDFDPVIHSSLNAYHGTHALRERANKIDQGILVIRFEVPFNFWCNGCGEHVGKGVRYNAEKKAIGNYFSTKILEFSMTCHLCQSPIKFQTDPKGCDYIISEGGRKKVETFSSESAETMEFMSKDEKKMITRDPMHRLEHGEEDKKRASVQKNRIEKICEIQQRNFDEFSMSQLVRRKFRFQTEKKHLLESDRESRRPNLALPLLPEEASDVQNAEQQSFSQVLRSATQTQRADRLIHLSRPLLGKVTDKRHQMQALLLKKVQNNIHSRSLGSSDSGTSSLCNPASLVLLSCAIPPAAPDSAAKTPTMSLTTTRNAKVGVYSLSQPSSLQSNMSLMNCVNQHSNVTTGLPTLTVCNYLPESVFSRRQNCRNMKQYHARSQKN